MDIKMTPPKLENPDGSRVDFNDISMESLGSHLFFGYVDETTIKEATAFVLKSNMLFAGCRDITIFLNTVGGNCYDGFALIDVMDVSRLNIRTVGMGNIVSMGVLLMSAGTKGKRVMTKNTQVMAHQHTGGVESKFHELVANHQAEIYLHGQMMNHFLKHTKMTEKQIKELVLGPTDRWLTPTECKKLGIVDHVIDELPDFNLAAVPVPAAELVRPIRSKIRDIDSKKKR